MCFFFLRFDLSGKCSNEAMKEEVEERRRAQVCTLPTDVIVLFYETV